MFSWNFPGSFPYFSMIKTISNCSLPWLLLRRTQQCCRSSLGFMVWLGPSRGMCCRTSSLRFFEFTFHERRRIFYLLVIRRMHSQFFFWTPDWASEILPTMLISCRSLLQWNITELITYLQVLPFHSYIPNEFFPMTSSFVSIALSLILSHLLYLTSWLQDTVKCMEVVLFQGCPRTLLLHI